MANEPAIFESREDSTDAPGVHVCRDRPYTFAADHIDRSAPFSGDSRDAIDRFLNEHERELRERYET
ncbi:hypothetical protein [Halomicrobium mukohataei]|uniref:Uncharacterized protein n=1 Tax=Halomicrobium mukohataei (strain ATCC 700874 / DSM 12286 / JCM 9738 / NCIMB 13541) TaxID=485914 RepID=C7P540_HALMD|nr:hypothetical protein [Halomicrobium mukohataei]ACV49435.1 hypothetical protein Hmuk_3346 [Halomicrobium mukohataei DSM 12286]